MLRLKYRTKNDVLASQVAGGAEIYFEINVEEHGARLLLFSCRSAKFCCVDLLKSDNEARKARELASHWDAFYANSLEQQVASVPDVRRRHSAERPHFDLNFITEIISEIRLKSARWRWLKILEIEKSYSALKIFIISQKISLKLFFFMKTGFLLETFNWNFCQNGTE